MQRRLFNGIRHNVNYVSIKHLIPGGAPKNCYTVGDRSRRPCSVLSERHKQISENSLVSITAF